MNKLLKKDFVVVKDEIYYKKYGNYDFIIFFEPFYSCNYNCDYCYQNKYRQKYQFTEEKFQKQLEFFDYLTQVTPKKKRIDIFGGEPTINYNRFLIPFLERYKNDWDFVLVTNLSLSNDKLLNLIQNYTQIKEYAISVHFHKIKDFNKFIEKINLLINNNQFVELKILFENGYKKEIEFLIEKYKNCDNIYFDLKSITDYKNQVSEKFTDISLLEQYKKYNLKRLEYKIEYKGKKYYWRDFTKLKIKTKNKICTARSRYLMLDAKGNLFPCETYYWLYNLNNQYNLSILNIFNDNYTTLKLKNIICKVERCFIDFWL